MKKILPILALFLIILIAVGCAAPSPAPSPSPSPSPSPAPAPDSGASEDWPDTVNVGSFAKGSQTYPTAVATAQLISKYTPSDGIIREYGGTAPMFEALFRGDVDTAYPAASDTISAYYGRGFYQDKPQDIRLLIGAVYLGPNGIGVRADEGLTKVSDLAGKKCMVKWVIPSLNLQVESIMKSAGVWDKATIIDFASIPDIAPAIISKQVDCWFAAVGAAYTLEIKQATGIDYISLSQSEMEAGMAAVPGYVPWTMGPRLLKMYDFPPDRVINSLAYPLALTVRADMPDYMAYEIVKAFFDDNNLDEVRDLQGELEETSMELATKYFWVPFHEGAVKYYKENGAWDDEKEKKQQEYLKR